MSNAQNLNNGLITSVEDAILKALDAATAHQNPFQHWILGELLPDHIVDELAKIDFSAPDLGGVSGKRELHNDARHYFDAENQRNFPAMAQIANSFQGLHIAKALGEFFDADLNKTCLRIEYAVDTSGFWLQPHTDLGVKRLTILHYISDEPDQGDLGTDLYNSDKSWAKRAPFKRNTALAFTPGDATYHGFEQRNITGVRKSLIINYVTDEWRDREQLCFPNAPLTI